MTEQSKDRAFAVGAIVNNELKQRLIAALESAIENASELQSYAYKNCDSARYKRMVAMYQDQISECQALIKELPTDIDPDARKTPSL